MVDKVKPRCIFSLATLLAIFGMEYQPWNRDDLKMMRELDIELPNPFAQAVCGEEAFPLSDNGIAYEITSHDPRALRPREVLRHMIMELEECASCGCQECNEKIMRRREYYNHQKDN